jgi:hypothetical protein
MAKKAGNPQRQTRLAPRRVIRQGTGIQGANDMFQAPGPNRVEKVLLRSHDRFETPTDIANYRRQHHRLYGTCQIR